MSDQVGAVPGAAPPTGGVPWSAGDAIGFGWAAVKANPGIVVALFVGGLLSALIGVLGEMVIHIANSARDGDVSTFAAFLAYGLMVLNIPISCWIQMGMVRYALRVARGERPEFAVIFSGGPFLTFLATTLLTGIAIAAGLLFCIVPGVFLMICWCFWDFLVIDKEADVVESMRRSWNMTEGRRMDLFGFFLLLFLLNLLGLVLCGVGLIVTGAITHVAAAWTYLKFVEMSPAAAAGPQD